MNIAAAKTSHGLLVKERAKIIQTFTVDQEPRLKEIERKLGHLGQAWNDRLSAKAQTWFERN